MSRESINLFKERFLKYNRVRYSDVDNWRIALESLTVDDINVLKYMPDPESQYRTVLTEVQSDKFSLTGLDQRYTKAYFGTDTISKLSDKTIYPDLISILNMNVLGVFFYENQEEPEFPHVVIATSFLRKWTEGIEFINEVMSNINKYTHYDLLQSECDIQKNEEDSSGDRVVVDVVIDNHTIWGSIKVGQIPAAYPLGTYPYEYLGKFNEFHLIGKDALLTLANIVDGPMDEQYQLKTPLVWLKFRYYGRTLYVPKYPILTNVSWNLLNERGMTSGKTVITGADGQEYRLRLLNISDIDNENEWDNLIKRCVADSGMTEWEAFNYKNEMQYGYRAGITYYYSGVLTEGVTADEQRYIVGGRALVNEKSPVSPIAKQTAKTIDSYTNITYAGWLPVLELRGVDPIISNTIHPHWIDLKDPIPEQVYADVEPDPNMVFSIRLMDTDFIGPAETDLEIVIDGESDASKLILLRTTSTSLLEDPDLSIELDGTGTVNKAILLTIKDTSTLEGFTDLSVDAKQDAFYVGYKRHTTAFASVLPPDPYVATEAEANVKFVSLKTVSKPQGSLATPYCFI